MLDSVGSHDTSLPISDWTEDDEQYFSQLGIGTCESGQTGKPNEKLASLPEMKPKTITFNPCRKKSDSNKDCKNKVQHQIQEAADGWQFEDEMEIQEFPTQKKSDTDVLSRVTEDILIDERYMYSYTVELRSGYILGCCETFRVFVHSVTRIFLSFSLLIILKSMENAFVLFIKVKMKYLHNG